MQFDKIKQEWEQTQSQIADMRARLVEERRKHEDAIKAIDGLMAQLLGVKPAKAPAALKPVAVEGGPTLGTAIREIVKGQPGITTAQLVAALPDRPKKSVENTASRLVSEGKLVREAKGYAVAAA